MRQMKIVVLCVLTGTLLAPAPLWAQLSVSPSRSTLRLKPGQVATGFLKVENQHTEPVVVNMEVEEWSGGISGPRGAVGWLTIKPIRFTLAAGKSRKVSYTVRVPREATGELAAQIFFTTEQQGGGLTVKTRQGAILYVAIQGTEQVGLEITSLRCFYTAATPGIAKPDRLEVVVDLKNRGTVHLVPRGEVVIHDTSGQLRYRFPIQSGWGLLPHEQDAYRAVLHGVYLDPGTYRVSVQVEGGEEFAQPQLIERTVEVRVGPDGHIR